MWSSVSGESEVNELTHTRKRESNTCWLFDSAGNIHSKQAVKSGGGLGPAGGDEEREGPNNLPEGKTVCLCGCVLVCLQPGCNFELKVNQ